MSPRLLGPGTATVAFVVAILVTVVVEWVGYQGQIVPTVADGITGATLLICGVVAWQRRSVSRVGPLMILSGFGWLLGTLVPALVLVHRGPLVHLHISYPTGRLHRTLAIVTVAVAYVVALVEPMTRNDVLTLVLAGLISVAAVDMFVRTAGPARKAGVPALIAAFAFAGVLTLGAVGRLAGWGVDRQMLLLYDGVVTSVAILLLLDLLYGRWVDSTVADLVVGLGDAESVSLRDQLRRAMGDSSVEIGYWIPEQETYVDDAGNPVDVPRNGETRSVTVIRDGEQPLAVLVHDAVVGQDQQLMAAVSTAARMAMTNARLRADIRERALRIAESRRRIVEAADRQRLDLEHRLAVGTLSRLAEVSRALDGVTANDARELRAELDCARDELLDFARGVRPADLSAGGLAAALPVLSGRSPVPVDLSVRVGRLPPVIEACVYFVCSEALANAAKHANARRVAVTVQSFSGEVRVSIVDDGTGGADPSVGTGLRGLVDRVEALGGTLTLRSRRGEGTELSVAVPTA